MIGAMVIVLLQAVAATFVAVAVWRADDRVRADFAGDDGTMAAASIAESSMICACCLLLAVVLWALFVILAMLRLVIG